MKRFVASTMLACVLTATAIAGEIPTTGSPNPGEIPSTGVSIAGEIPTTGAPGTESASNSGVLTAILAILGIVA